MSGIAGSVEAGRPSWEVLLIGGSSGTGKTLAARPLEELPERILAAVSE